MRIYQKVNTYMYVGVICCPETILALKLKSFLHPGSDTFTDRRDLIYFIKVVLLSRLPGLL